jgi:hypothetical protein
MSLMAAVAGVLALTVITCRDMISCARIEQSSEQNELKVEEDGRSSLIGIN